MRAGDDTQSEFPRGQLTRPPKCPKATSRIGMPRSASLGETCFSGEDQLRFAALSGDRNPMHLDPVYARRTQFGRQVVHGIHVLLWGLDQFFSVVDTARPTALRVRFSKPTFVGDRVSVSVTTPKIDEWNLEISASGITVATASLSARAPSRAVAPFVHPGDEGPSAFPRDLGLSDIEGRTGSMGLAAETIAGAAVAFGAVTRALSRTTVAALLATSRLVGMECPGLHSIFAGFAVDLVEGGPMEALSWHVFRIDNRFRRVELDVNGGGIVGRLETFVRIPPTRQLGMHEICAAVGRDEFVGQRALVIGGSRGLGEITAKIIAAGGGFPMITYSVGQSDADAVAAEIAATGRGCEVIHYDATVPAAPQLARHRLAPTSFYYFAACSIFRRKTALYEPALMDEFIRLFVDGFYDLCSALRAQETGRLAGFYPSTVAIDAPLRDLTEYCLAKLAGEALCAQLQTFLPELYLVVERLPRTQTDQTATLLPVHAEAPLKVMLPIVRTIQAATTTAANRRVHPADLQATAQDNHAKRKS